jgi:DNA polymerase V
MILHIDANSFYASCEQAFRPDLRCKPVIVLSNNDGIIIALNKEAKKFGLKRGDAFFQVRDLIKEHSVSVFSSNYTLYADMSERINQILKSLCPEVEVYSIDESFLFFPELRQINEIAQSIKETVEQATGIPVSIGIAYTKTLSKLANKLAKKRGGILNLSDIDLDEELRAYPVEDIWGIGYRYSAFLKERGVHTAFDLKSYPLHLAKKNLTIKGVFTVQELNGIPSIDLMIPKPKKNIISSRGFSRLVEKKEELEEAAANYCLEAIRKMRDQHSAAKSIGVSLMTNRFREDLPQCFDSVEYKINPPSSYVPELLKLALRGVNELHKPGYKYQKVMIMLLGLVPDEISQFDFFSEDKNKEKAIMACFDKINGKYDKDTLFIGARGIDRNWSMKREYLSPSYTTDLEGIPKVR